MSLTAQICAPPMLSPPNYTASNSPQDPCLQNLGCCYYYTRTSSHTSYQAEFLPPVPSCNSIACSPPCPKSSKTIPIPPQNYPFEPLQSPSTTSCRCPNTKMDQHWHRHTHIAGCCLLDRRERESMSKHCLCSAYLPIVTRHRHCSGKWHSPCRPDSIRRTW